MKLTPTSSVTTELDPLASEIECATEAARFMRMLNQPRIAVRILPKWREVYGELSDVDEFALAVIRLSREQPAAGVYILTNPISPQAFENVTKREARTICAQAVERRRDLCIDIDPRRGRPQGGSVSANDTERAWAKRTMEKAVTYAADHGFPSPVVVDSGSGFQLHYRIDLPNDDASRKLVKDVLVKFAAEFDCDEGVIDTTHDAAVRFTRLPGTYNCKGPHCADRPHRLARIVSAPANDILVTTDALTLRRFVEPQIALTSRLEVSTDAARQRSSAVELLLALVAAPLALIRRLGRSEAISICQL